MAMRATKAHTSVQMPRARCAGTSPCTRAKVEHPFRVLKRKFGHVKVRYRGLAKNTTQLHTLFALANLWLVRRKLLASAA